MRIILLFAAFLAWVGVASAHTVAVGYSNGQVAETSPYKISGKGHVSAAVYITPEVYEKYAQCDFMGISVGLASAKYCDSLTVWVRETLDGEDIVTKTIKRSNNDAIDQGWNNILFDTPMPLEGKSFYIGYTYHQSYKDGAVSVVGEPRPNTSYLKRGNLASWEDISSEGVLSIELLVGGDNMPPYDLKVVSATATRSGDGVVTVVTNIINNGSKDVTEYDLTFSAEGYNYVKTISTPIASGANTKVSTILYDVPEAVGFDLPLTVTATRIADGEDYFPEDNSTVASMRIPRNVVVEEFTGTGCGWCPRGLVGMDKMHERYGERFVGIGIHQYNSSDPMYPTRYKNLGFDGAPECKIDRSYLTDPYYGKGNDICDDFEAEMEVPTYISVMVSATFNADRTAVDITADLSSQAALNGLSVGFVLTADSVTGTERAWKQANYYYQYQPSQLPDDLKQFGNGGVNGGSSFFWSFNDVAIGTYYEGGKYEMSIGNIGKRETKTVTATVDMPTKAALVNALRYDLITANVLVLDDKGVVANAAKVRVVDPTDVKELDVKPAGNLREVARYTLDGRMISTPQKGINIVKLSDGSTIKVNVK